MEDTAWETVDAEAWENSTETKTPTNEETNRPKKTRKAKKEVSEGILITHERSGGDRQQDAFDRFQTEQKDRFSRYLALLAEAEDISVTHQNGDYRYLSTSDALNYAKELTRKHEFIIRFSIKSSMEGRYNLETSLIDIKTGLSPCPDIYFPLGSHADIRITGAEVTCARRYSILLLLNITSVDENEEALLDGKKKSATRIPSAAAEPLPTPAAEPPAPKARVEKPVKPAEPIEQRTVDVEAPARTEPTLQESISGMSLRDQLLTVFAVLEHKNLLHKLKDAQIASLKAYREGKRDFLERDLQSAINHLSRVLEDNS